MREILFDAQALLGKKTGVGYYNSILLDQIRDQKGDHKFTLIYFESVFSRKDTKYLAQKYPDLQLRAHRLIPKRIALKLIGSIFEPRIGFLWPGGYDAVIFPNFYGFKKKRASKIALSIPDLAYLKYPEVLPTARRGLLGKLLPSGPDFLTKVTSKQIPSSDIILTISNTVKRELCDEFSLPATRIIVTSLGPKQHVESAPRPSPEKYFLFVGTLEPRKNIITLLEAYEKLDKNVLQEYGLTIVGGLGWKYDTILEKIESMQKAGLNVSRLGYVSSAQKATLYSNATIYIQPSIYEGFGMPLLEAMSYNIPVICSDIPIFREVANEAALYFAAQESENLAQIIEGLVTNTELRKQLIKNGADRVAKYQSDVSGVNELLGRL